jgi:large subunit ribosomal protein L9
MAVDERKRQRVVELHHVLGHQGRQFFLDGGIVLGLVNQDGQVGVWTQLLRDVFQFADVVKVSDGFARNFLIPKRLVVPADEKNLAAINHQKKILEKKRQAEKTAAQDVVQKLAAHSCTIARKVGENDKLFGSVGAADIAAELKKAGFKVDKRSIQLDDTIKALGVHSVSVRLLPEVTATVKVWVVKQES